MRSTVHPLLQQDLEALANQGFRLEASIGQVFGAIDDRFLEGVSDDEAQANWQRLASADAVIGIDYDLRCIDPADGRVTLIAALGGDVLYLLSAGESTSLGRREAVQRAAARMQDLSWVDPA